MGFVYSWIEGYGNIILQGLSGRKPVLVSLPPAGIHIMCLPVLPCNEQLFIIIKHRKYIYCNVYWNNPYNCNGIIIAVTTFTQTLLLSCLEALSTCWLIKG